MEAWSSAALRTPKLGFDFPKTSLAGSYILVRIVSTNDSGSNGFDEELGKMDEEEVGFGSNIVVPVTIAVELELELELVEELDVTTGGLIVIISVAEPVILRVF
jgi:hypothetical protein